MTLELFYEFPRGEKHIVENIEDLCVCDVLICRNSKNITGNRLSKLICYKYTLHTSTSDTGEGSMLTYVILTYEY